MVSLPQLQNGHAALHVGFVRERSVVLRSWSRNPLRLLAPRVNHSGVWAYTSTFGGGLVAGDCTHMDVQVDPGACCFLGTQSSTKVYRNCCALPCSHRLTATLADDSLLVVVPDPVQPFADSVYDQAQRFDLAPTASLVLVDSVSSGRTARGERWSFQRYSSRIDVVRENRLLLSDRIRLEPTAPQRFATGRFNGFATILLLGPKVAGHAKSIHDSIAAEPILRAASLVAASSPLHDGVLVRIAGIHADEVRHSIHQQLRFVGDLLHDDPFTRKW